VEFDANSVPANGKIVWVEAMGRSDTLRDIQIELTYSAAPNVKDTVRATAIWAVKEAFIASQVVTSLVIGGTISGSTVVHLQTTAGFQPGDNLLIYPGGGSAPHSYTVQSVLNGTQVMLTTPLTQNYAAGAEVRQGYPGGLDNTAMIDTFLGGRTASDLGDQNYATSGFLGTNSNRYNSMLLRFRLLPAGIGQAVRDQFVKVDVTRQRQDVVRWTSRPDQNEDVEFPDGEEAYNDDSGNRPDEDTDCSAGVDLIYVRDMPGTPKTSVGSIPGDEFVQLMNMQEFVRIGFGNPFPSTLPREGAAIGSRASAYVPWHSLLHITATGALIPASGGQREWVRAPGPLNEIAEGNINPDANGRGIAGSLEELLP
jgi:hypothetical protein